MTRPGTAAPACLPHFLPQQGAAVIDLAKLYNVLREVALYRGVISYEDLSRRYNEAGGDWQEEGAWGVPLAGLNGRTKAAGLPPLSALVTSKPRAADNFGPPTAEGFWDSPGVPPRPARRDDQLLIWMGFVNLAHRAAWPEELPGSAPAQ